MKNNTPKLSERKQALDALLTLSQQKVPLSYLTPQLSPFSRELLYGVCRQLIRLTCIANALIPKKPKVEAVWYAMLLGLYQLHFLKLPDYAVVKETVNLLSHKNQWAKGLINAALRRFCRESETIIAALADDENFKFGHPSWFIKRVKTNWPLHWEALLEANDQHPPMTIRVNTQQISVENYQNLLKQHQIDAIRHPIAQDALTLITPCDVQKLPHFNQGFCSVQDAAAQLAASLLNLSPQLRVLDACSAPGGKTGHLLEKEPHLKTCVALDVDEKRLFRVQQNLDRLGLSATLIVSDASKPEAWWDGLLFDRILLDAPCSATGVIRRHPDIKLLRTEIEIAEVVKTQAKLLTVLWPLLAPGGRLIYATCSIMPEENELQIAQFCSNQADCKIIPIAEHLNTNEQLVWGIDTSHGRQILPGIYQMDGFFYSILEKIK